eukprot:m.56919 g.56919  ORF g.56919 m.56919 type:complete len:529 (-) comp17036_c0_seq1:364-1950(-)
MEPPPQTMGMGNALELIQRQLADDEEQQGAAAAAASELGTGLLPVPDAPAPAPMSASVLAGIAAGNINLTTSTDRMALSGAAKTEVDRHEELLAQFERRKQIRQLHVPTDDGEVKKMLREYANPICLFGEGPGERRDRLRDLIASLGDRAAIRKRPLTEDVGGEAQDEVQEVWYHEGSAELKEERMKIAEYSLTKARDRLKRARLKLARPDPEENADRQKLHNRLRNFGNYCSQVGDNRPISSCEFSPDGKTLATASWSGLCKLWSVPECTLKRTLKGHTQRVSCITWHPQATLSQESSALNMATSDADGVVRLWNLDSDAPIDTIKGHSKRVPRLSFHPSGRYLGTACYDNSWRLWDVERKEEVLHQEGHSRPVYCMAFHKDGSLVGTGGLDAHGRIWDMRSGKNVLVLQGHLKEILGIDFSSNGYHCVTGSDDHTVRLWDLRQRKSVYTIPAHTNLVSSLKYHPDGETLVTGSFDNTAKIWGMPGCSSLKTLNGHEGKVMCVDISNDCKFVVSGSYDRTFKLWATE